MRGRDREKTALGGVCARYTERKGEGERESRRAEEAGGQGTERGRGAMEEPHCMRGRNREKTALGCVCARYEPAIALYTDPSFVASTRLRRESMARC